LQPTSDPRLARARDLVVEQLNRLSEKTFVAAEHLIDLRARATINWHGANSSRTDP
jgi:hypothetical protein